jgi:hypothetical protein
MTPWAGRQVQKLLNSRRRGYTAAKIHIVADPILATSRQRSIDRGGRDERRHVTSATGEARTVG